MTPERWKRLDALFHEALELRGEARAAHLTKVCGDDEQLRAEAERLLAAHERESGFIDSPILAEAATQTGDDNESPVGCSIGHYKVVSILGRGGMGEVYLAEDYRLERKVALKMLPAAFTQQPDRVWRFEREAKSASALNHPNILTIYEVGVASTEDGGGHYIVSEFVEGETVRALIGRGGLDINQATAIADQIAGALGVAHEAGIIHRDIKPENVMVRPDGLVKVLDFGLAKLMERPAARPEADSQAETLARLSSEPGVVIGTVSYMSPEQARGQKVDQRTDIFSLGVMLYEMLAGRRPFEGASASDVIAALLTSQPDPVSGFRPETPPELEQVLSKCLEKRPDDRYQTSRELQNDLKGLDKEWRRRAQAEPNRVKTSTRGYGGIATLDWFRRHRAGTIFVGVALLALLGVWFFFGSRSAAIDSLAVLPFQSGDVKADNEYLGDGLTESLITNLAQLPNLKVISSSSAFTFKNKTTDPQVVGQTLGVRALLTGRITQVGDDLAISVELTDARDRRHLWGARYSRKLGDILSLHREIAEDVSEKLRLRLSGEDKNLLARLETESNDAYQFYLQGRSYLRQRSAQAIRQAQRFFQQALDKDPKYALALSGLSDSFTLLAAQNALPTNEAFESAMKTAGDAVKIAPDLAEARTSLAHVLFHTNDLAGAEREFKRAQQIKPNYALAQHWYAEYLGRTNRPNEALAALKLALELDPLDLATNAELGWHYLSTQQHEQAIAQYRKTLDINPNYFLARKGLAETYLKIGDYVEAIDGFKQVAGLTGGNRGLEGLGLAYALSGQREKAIQVVAELQTMAKQKPLEPLGLAAIYAALGEKDRAFALLERTFTEAPQALSSLQKNRAFYVLRSDARCAALLRRAGLEP